MEEVKTWRYVVPSVNSEGWGIFLLDEKGYFSCITDWGNYAYYWTHFGERDFREFLIGIDHGYLLGKIAPEKIYDEEETEKAIRQRVLDLRRRGGFSRDEARAEWDRLEEHDISNPEGFAIWYMETEIPDAHEERRSMCKPQAKYFVERTWPRFVAILKAELSGVEAKP